MSLLAALVGPKADWMRDAACRPHQHATFFTEAGSRRGTQAAKIAEHRAKLICAGCPVRKECLRYALDFADARGLWDEKREQYYRPNPVGIYGGVTPAERNHKALRHLPTDVRVGLLDEMFKAQAEGFLPKGRDVV